MKKKKLRKRYKGGTIKLNNLIRELRYLFGVQNLDCYPVREQKDCEDGVHIAASVVIDEDYQRLYIYFYPCFFRARTALQRQYLLHEFCHSLTTRLLACADDLRAGKLVTPQQIKSASEEATSRATNIIECMLLGYEKDAQVAYKKYVDPKKR